MKITKIAFKPPYSPEEVPYHINKYGLRFDIELKGQYHPPTKETPEEFPEVNIVDVSLKNFNEFYDALYDLMGNNRRNDIDQKMKDIIDNHNKSLGFYPEHIELRLLNNTVLIFSTPTPNPQDATIANIIIDENAMVQNLPDIWEQEIKKNVWGFLGKRP